MIRADSTKSDNSLEDHAFCRSYRENHNRIPSPHLIPQVQRENNQFRIIETDPDAMQIIGEMELQQLPEAVNREILKNSREIIHDEEPSIPKRISHKHPFIADEERLLRRNLSYNKNSAIIDDDKRSLNGSRRNLNGSKRYLLVSLDKAEGLNGSAKNLSVDSRENLINARRHTGSKERLNMIKRNVKGSREYPEARRKKPIEGPPIETLTTQIEIEMEKPPKTIIGLTDVTQQNEIPTESILTPESGYAESTHFNSSPESSQQEIQFPSNSMISRNRRSYEHAQLQDVNLALTRASSGSSSSDSDGPAKDVKPDGMSTQNRSSPSTTTRQTISYTSV